MFNVKKEVEKNVEQSISIYLDLLRFEVKFSNLYDVEFLHCTILGYLRCAQENNLLSYTRCNDIKKLIKDVYSGLK